MKKRFVLILLLLSLVGCKTAPDNPIVTMSTTTTFMTSQTTKITTTSSTAKPVDPIEVLLDTMTLEEKIGQLIFLSCNSTILEEETMQQMQRIQPGGYVFFQKSIDNISQFQSLVKTLYEQSRIAPFFSTDQEGGRVQRFQNTPGIGASDIPAMQEVGRHENSKLAYDMGMLIGSELQVFGINMDFAPCADILSNPDNKAIGDRAFSSNAEMVATLSTALADGLLKSGIIPVCKHFPGHGDTVEDTHDGYAASYKTLDELYETELIPFQAQIANGIPAIMVAHISLPNLLGDSTPCTMSYDIVTKLLREEMGFDGVIVTDALNMGAIVQNYTAGQAAVTAILAGCDILLTPAEPQETFDSLCDAIQDGLITQERLDESVRRILQLKMEFDVASSPQFADSSILQSDAHLALINQVKGEN